MDIASPFGTRQNPLIGSSPPVLTLLERIEKIAKSTFPVLIQGESGTGKELVAQRLFNFRPRGQFVPVDCGALSPNLIESELFGHARGAFTGAGLARPGLLQTANGGTAFFDEIGELPAEGQCKLLRVLQQQEIRPVGSDCSRPCTFRVIAATNRDLEEEVKKGKFRLDLYYRLNVLTIDVPPLRQRREDIPGLVDYFLRKSGHDHEVTAEVLSALAAHDWPGNIRELENAVYCMAAVSPDRKLHAQDLQFFNRSKLSGDAPAPITEIQARALGAAVGASPRQAWAVAPVPPVVGPSLRSAERVMIEQTLHGADRNLTETARLLGISRTTLYRRRKNYVLPVSSQPMGLLQSQ